MRRRRGLATRPSGLAFGLAGANPRELMERMGHSTSRAALTYLHSTSARQHHLADAVTARARSEVGQTDEP